MKISGARARDSGFARQSDGRSRRHARRRRVGRAAVPSGASTGRARSARAARRRQEALSRQGRHARRSRNVNGEIATALVGRDADQRAVDAAMIELDGTPNKGRLGANAMLGVSMALARAGGGAQPACRSTPPRRALRRATRLGTLPVPMMNILNGGEHADSSVDFQEFMVMPVGAAVVRRGAARRRRNLSRAARHPEEEGTLDRRRRRRRLRAEPEVEPRGARRRARSRRARPATRPGEDIFIALDAASSELWNERATATSSRSPASQTRTLGRDGRSSTRTGSGSTRSSRSRTASPRTTGTAGRR